MHDLPRFRVRTIKETKCNEEEVRKGKTLTSLKDERGKVWCMHRGDKIKTIAVDLVFLACAALGDSRVRTWDKNDKQQEHLNNTEEDGTDDLDNVDTEM